MPKALSATARMILEILRENSRASLSEIAATMNISRTTVSYHLDRLVEQGVIRRFTIDIHPDLDVRPSGIRALFDLQLRRNVCGIVFAFISDWKELVSAWSTSGSTDMRILVEAADQILIESLRDRLARHPEVASLTTTMVLKTWCERISGVHETTAKYFSFNKETQQFMPPTAELTAGSNGDFTADALADPAITPSLSAAVEGSISTHPAAGDKES